MTLYNLKSALDDYRITKFDRDLNPESSYLLGPDDRGIIQCECPAGVRSSCRHRQMLPHLLPLVDTEWFWDFERNLCVDGDGNQRTALPQTQTALTATEPLITIEGSMPNQFVVVENDERGKGIVPAKAPSTIGPLVRIPKQWRNWRRI